MFQNCDTQNKVLKIRLFVIDTTNSRIFVIFTEKIAEFFKKVCVFGYLKKRSILKTRFYFLCLLLFFNFFFQLLIKKYAKIKLFVKIKSSKTYDLMQNARKTDAARIILEGNLELYVKVTPE